MSPINQSAIRNRLLAALPPEDFAALAEHLRPVEMRLKQVLHEPGRPIRRVHFPEGGIVSHVLPLETGHGVEVGVVGREGMLGLAVVLGDCRATVEALVQAEGRAWTVDAADIQAAFDRSRPLRSLLLRYAHAFHVQVAQTAACNRAHPIDGRLVRWLLMCQDRAHSAKMETTHEFIATMLGVRRAGVTEAAGQLRDKGLIDYRRGHVTILDRAGLEAASCECYPIIGREFNRLLG